MRSGRLSESRLCPRKRSSARSRAASSYFSSSSPSALLMRWKSERSKISGPSSSYSFTTSEAGSGSGAQSAQARMPPVEVPAIRSNSSKIRRPARRSSSVRTRAGMRPRIPPPSMASTRMPATVVATTVPVRAALLIVLCCAAATLGGPAAARPTQFDDNPRIGPDARQLRCPDLLMRQPYGLYTDRLTKAGHTVLRAGNVIDSIGTGPAELRGYRRIGPRFMLARQRIVRRDGRRAAVDTGARLQVKFAHQSRYWWKFYNAARFELWRVDADGERTRLVRTGPKVAYCLRDLTRTRPKLRRSPRVAHYPACSTNPDVQHVTIGTSPGWADIYPPAYPEQWIDVTGLRGCFAYVHIADPENGIFESNEDNNEAQAIIRLPYRSDHPRQGCHGRDRGRSFNPNRYP